MVELEVSLRTYLNPSLLSPLLGRPILNMFGTLQYKFIYKDWATGLKRAALTGLEYLRVWTECDYTVFGQVIFGYK